MMRMLLLSTNLLAMPNSSLTDHAYLAHRHLVTSHHQRRLYCQTIYAIVMRMVSGLLSKMMIKIKLLQRKGTYIVDILHHI
jgi:predicted GNAT family acetyltransferase